MSPIFTSSTLTTFTLSPSTKFALFTLILVMSSIFLLDFSSANSSRNSPNLNNKTTKQLSGYSPFINAPIIAIVINVLSSKLNLNKFFIPSINKSYPASNTAIKYIQILYSAKAGINPIPNKTNESI